MKHSQFDDYLDHSDDLVARVRTAKEAAQRKMEEFGDPSEYEITILQGHGPRKPVSETPRRSEEPEPPIEVGKPDTNSEKKSPRRTVKNERTEVGPEVTTTDTTDATRNEEQ